LEKQRHGGERDANTENRYLEQTRERLADAYGVSRDTIERDGQFAEAVDTLEAQVRALRGPF
jgi:hypothetical protein